MTPTHPTDADIVNDVLGGKRDAFQLLVERHLRTVQAVAMAKTGNYADAQDATQDVFLKAFQSLHTLRDPAKFGGWLRSIAVNVATTVLRKRQRDTALSRELPRANTVVYPDADRRELRDLLKMEVKQLEEGPREVLLLYYYAGLDTPAIAELLESTPNAIKKRLQRARRALSERLTDNIGDLLEEDNTKRLTAPGIMVAVSQAEAGWVSGGATGAVMSATAVGGLSIAKIAAVAVVVLAATAGLWAWQSKLLDPKPKTPVVAPVSSHKDLAPAREFETEEPLLLAANDEAPTEHESEKSEVTLPPADAHTAAGLVTDEYGDAVSAATVWAVRADLEGTIHERLTATTGTDGAYSLALTPGRWMIRAKKGTLAGTLADGYGIFRVKEGEGVGDESFTIRLVEAGTFSGTVFDADSGSGIPHAQIWTDEGVLIQADSHGGFRYEGLELKNHYLYAATPGYEVKRFLFDTSLREDARIHLRVRRAGQIRGRVVDVEGRPVAHALVGNQGSGNTIALMARYVRADRHGAFVRDGVPFNSFMQLYASAPDFLGAKGHAVMLLPGEDAEEVVIALRPDPEAGPSPLLSRQGPPESLIPQRSITGTVLNAAGEPVADARVDWGERYPDYDSTRTDDTGAFTLVNIPAAAGKLEVTAETYAPLYASIEADTTSAPELILQPGARVHGVVRDSAGEPIEGVWVIPHAPDGTNRPRSFTRFDDRTDAEGRFELNELPEEDPRVTFLAKGMSEQRRIKVQTGDTENEITLQGSGAVRGQVRYPDGSPCTDFAVLVHITREKQPSGSMFAGYNNIGIQFANPDGIFVVSELEANKYYKVFVVAEGYAHAVVDPVQARPLETVADSDVTEFNLTPAPPLNVLVQNEAGEPVPNASVILHENTEMEFTWGGRGWDRRQHTITEADGWATFAAVGAKKGAIGVRAAGYGVASQLWDGQAEELRFVLPLAGAAQGFITNTEGLPVPETFVALNLRGTKAGKGISFETYTGASGWFHLDNLPPGEYQVSAYGRTPGKIDTFITIAAGETFEDTFVLTVEETQPQPN